MRRPICALLLLAASCGEITDEGQLCTEAESNANDPKCGRPLELAFITSAILAPSCGQTQCHSRFRAAGELIFDNPRDAAISMLVDTSALQPLLAFTADRFDPTGIDTYKPWLLRFLTEEFPLSDLDSVTDTYDRMPFEAPLARADIDLIKVWIQAEITADDPLGRPPRPGASARGAQCNPESHGGYACAQQSDSSWARVRCTDDFNFGEIDQRCNNSCTLSDDFGAVCD